MAATRRRFIAKRLQLAAVVVVLLTEWYVLAWVCWPTIAWKSSPPVPYPALKQLDRAFEPLWWYCRNQYPGGEAAYRVWWLANGTGPYDGFRERRF